MKKVLLFLSIICMLTPTNNVQARRPIWHYPILNILGALIGYGISSIIGKSETFGSYSIMMGVISLPLLVFIHDIASEMAFHMEINKIMSEYNKDSELAAINKYISQWQYRAENNEIFTESNVLWGSSRIVGYSTNGTIDDQIGSVQHTMTRNNIVSEDTTLYLFQSGTSIYFSISFTKGMELTLESLRAALTPYYIE